jgi:hypothetical protein
MKQIPTQSLIRMAPKLSSYQTINSREKTSNKIRAQTVSWKKHFTNK